MLVTNEKELNYQEAAEYLKLSVDMVRRKVARRELRAIRYGHKTVRFKPVDLDAFKERCATPVYGKAVAHA